MNLPRATRVSQILIPYPGYDRKSNASQITLSFVLKPITVFTVCTPTLVFCVV